MIDTGQAPLTALQRFARRAAQVADAAAERCDLCSEPLPPSHRHLLTVDTREIQCVCRACWLLFSQAAASEGKHRLVPERRQLVSDFLLSDAQWASLRVPVGLAFLLYSTPRGQIVGCYPSPMGPVEALPPPEMWNALVASNPILRTLEPDVEALLVHRARGAAAHYLVPIDECYSLVGLIRRRWRGLGGGQEVWAEIGRFFEALGARSASVSRASGGPP
jgi:hypothetical protein